MGTIFEVQGDILKAAVAFVRNGLGAGKSIVEKSIRFDIKASEATGILSASDGDLIVSEAFQVKGGVAAQTDAFAMMGTSLVALVGTAPAEIYQFTVDDENIQIVAVGGGDARSNLTVNFEKYEPDMLDFALTAREKVASEQLGPDELTLPQGPFQEALGIAARSVVKNAGNPEVAHVELRGGFVLASDNRKISAVRHEKFHKAAELKVPVPVLGRLSKAAATAGDLFPWAGDHHFYLVGTDAKRVIAVRKTDAVFPAIEDRLMIRDDAVDVVQIRREDFQRALEQVALGLPSGQEGITISISTGAFGGALEITAENTLGRKSVKALDVQRTGDGVHTFPISVEHILKVLPGMDGETVTLYVREALAAALLVDTSPTREIMVMIPWRQAADAEPEEPADPTRLDQQEPPGSDDSTVVL